MSKSRQKSKLVYSTEGPVSGSDKTRNSSGDTPSKTLYLKREVKGRKGKTVTTITAAGWTDEALSELSSALKKHCGTGGSVKEGIIIIQGDQRTKITSFLSDKGYQVKLAGG